jgi:large subunit ribosomal protein L24e
VGPNRVVVWINQDTTFEFERKRNRPERYDRILTEQTLKAIPLITKIRHERQKKHITERSVAVSLTRHICLFSEWSRCLTHTIFFPSNRQKGGKSMSRKKDAKELEQDLQMLPKKDTVAYEATKQKVIVSQLKTEENLMEE